eukprot:19642-Heterococcus_DN1.PRE.2
MWRCSEDASEPVRVHMQSSHRVLTLVGLTCCSCLGCKLQFSAKFDVDVKPRACAERSSARVVSIATRGTQVQRSSQL